MRRRRGNILLMALFMSLFLFFLSVALVAQNRQDVLLTLAEEHRLRADAAARAGLELAMHVMRTAPDWKARLEGAAGDLETGGEWTVGVPQPVAGSPRLLEIRAEGTSGIARVTRRRIVEELAMAHEETPGPHLFAFTEQGTLAMLGPDFRWSELGIPPDPQSWLVADGGPLFSHVRGDPAGPPQLVDLTARGMAPVALTVEPGRGVTWLEFAQDTMAWQEIVPPDASTRPEGAPGSNLYRSLEGVVDGTTWRGPCVDWYALAGDALVAQGRRVYSHANHYFYRGARGTLAGQGFILEEPGRQFSSTAVLEYDLDTKRWSVAMDLMRVDDLRRDPDLTPASSTRTANQQTLGLVDGTFYALEAGNDRRVLRAGPRSWSFERESPAISRGLYAYGGRLRLHNTSGTQDDTPRIALSEGLDPWTDLSVDRPAVSGALWDTETQSFEERAVAPGKRLRPNLLGDLLKTTTFLSGGGQDGSHCVAVQGPDLYTFARLRVDYLAAEGTDYLRYPASFLEQNRTREVVVLAHYDGTRWQVWPGGLYDLSVAAPQEATTMVHVGNLLLDPHALAAASYPGTDQVRLNRYSPVVDLP